MEIAARGGRCRTALAAAALAAVLTPTPKAAPTVGVVVLAREGSAAAAEAVRSVGGSVGRALGLVDGVAARVPADRVDDLSAQPGVHVAADERVRPMGLLPDPAVLQNLLAPLAPVAAVDTGSMGAVTKVTGAQELWARGLTGRGVDVAVIDTGVADVPGLAGKVVHGADLSFDAQEGLPAHVDAYGHGTHMAGIIAGSDVDASDPAGLALASADPERFVGMAPGSRVVNVKVGAFDGATDVSQVIAALEWIVAHKDDGDLNVRVVNLSFGLNSSNPYHLDPLALAAERAMANGVLVVAAAGNDGGLPGQLSSPAYTPHVLAVGAEDPVGTYDRKDDVIPDFANHGTKDRKVDVVAPGVSVKSLRVPGSYADDRFGYTGRVGERFFKGSGTSQSTAVVSGLAALLFEQHPGATPQQVKDLIMGGASLLPKVPATSQGKGLVDGARSGARGLGGTGTGSTAPAATGTGSLEAARGGTHLIRDGLELAGEQDIFGKAWKAADWSATCKAGTSWVGGAWRGQQLTGEGWGDGGWEGTRWSAKPWSGGTWLMSSTDMAWDGSRWSSTSWSGSRWSGSRWSGSRWSGSRWSGSRWSSAGWSEEGWR